MTAVILNYEFCHKASLFPGSEHVQLGCIHSKENVLSVEGFFIDLKKRANRLALFIGLFLFLFQFNRFLFVITVKKRFNGPGKIFVFSCRISEVFFFGDGI